MRIQEDAQPSAVYRAVFDGVLRQMLASSDTTQISIIAPAGPWRKTLLGLRHNMSDAPVGREHAAIRRMYLFVKRAFERGARGPDSVHPAFCVSCSVRDGLNAYLMEPGWGPDYYFVSDDLVWRLSGKTPFPPHAAWA